MNACVFTGSFDPFTIGHLDIVKSGLKVFDKVYIAVLNNGNKAYKFSLEQRIQLVKAAVSDLTNTEVVSSDKTAVELAQQLNARAILRGIRTEKDLSYEMEMAFANRHINGGVETVFLPASKPQISSTVARWLIEFDGDLSSVLTDEQINILKNF